MKNKRKYLAIGKLQNRSRFPGTASASAASDLLFATSLFIAAVGGARFLGGFLFEVKLTAAGVTGALLGRAPAAFTGVSTLPCRSIGEVAAAQNHGRERTHDDYQIDNCKQQGCKKAWFCVSAFIQRGTKNSSSKSIPLTKALCLSNSANCTSRNGKMQNYLHPNRKVQIALNSH